jgi:hypothetical protein
MRRPSFTIHEGGPGGLDKMERFKRENKSSFYYGNASASADTQKRNRFMSLNRY